ncbi:MAG: serine hydrolase, partial [Sphingomonadales bacterium]|nr:serine hydrolase [Sphingomonadales bacterium]
PDSRLISWSMAKSVTATLIGMMVADGLLVLDDPAPVLEWSSPGDPRAKSHCGSCCTCRRASITLKWPRVTRRSMKPTPRGCCSWTGAKMWRAMQRSAILRPNRDAILSIQLRPAIFWPTL